MIEHENTTGFLIEVKDVGDSGSITVRAASFLSIDRKREMIMPGAYSRYVKNFAAKGRVFVDHTWSPARKIGRLYDAYETKDGLIGKAAFGRDSFSQEIRHKAANKELQDVSIGHQVILDQKRSPAEVKQIWARHNYQPSDYDRRMVEMPGPIRVIYEAEPLEFSIVGIPMNDQAEVLEVKSAGQIETKKGAVLSGNNAKALRQAYKLIRGIFKTARIEDLEDEIAQSTEPEGKSVEPESLTQGAAQTESKSASDVDVKAKRLRVELELMDLDDFGGDPADQGSQVEQSEPEATETCPVTQE